MPPPGGFGGMGSFGGRTAGVGERGNAPGGSGGGLESRTRSRGNRRDTSSGIDRAFSGLESALAEAIGAPTTDFFSHQRQAQLQRSAPVVAGFQRPVTFLEEDEEKIGPRRQSIRDARSIAQFSPSVALSNRISSMFPPAAPTAQAGPHIRDVYSLPNRFDRAVGGLLGIETTPTFDRTMPGNIGIAGRLNPISLLGNALAGQGIVTGLQALNASMPFTAANAVATGIGNRGAVTRAGDFLSDFGIQTSFSLGTRPTRYSQAQAQSKARSGAPLSAADQLALNSIARDRQRQESMRASASGDSTQTPGAIAPAPIAVLPTPAPPVRAFRPASRGSRLLAGRDPSTGLDLLRTGHQAAVAQGLAPARPNVGVPGRPPRAGALV